MITQGVITLSQEKLSAVVFETIKECKDKYFPAEILLYLRKMRNLAPHYLCYFDKRPINDPVYETLVSVAENWNELGAKYLKIQGIVYIDKKRIRCRFGYPVGIPRIRVPELFYIIDHTAGRIYSLSELKMPDAFYCDSGLLRNHLLEIVKKPTLVKWIKTENPKIEGYIVPKEFYSIRYFGTETET